MKVFRVILTWCLLGFIWLLFMLAMTVSYADPIRGYSKPLVCTKFKLVDGIQVIDKSDEIVLAWKDFVSFGKGKMLFKYKGAIVSVPMEGYSCLPKAQVIPSK